MKQSQDHAVERASIDARGNSGGFTTYLIGFFLSILFTLIAFFMVEKNLAVGWTLWGTLAGLSFIQVTVQLYFFLHLGDEGTNSWNFSMFLFMLLVVFIVVAGTIWIMAHLNSNMMMPMSQ